MSFFAVSFEESGHSRISEGTTYLALSGVIEFVFTHHQSVGWSSGPGREDIHRAVQMARHEGILVVSSSLKNEFGFEFSGLALDPLEDPDLLSSYRAGSVITTVTGIHIPDREVIFFPMDCRTVAEESSDSAYRYDPRGGLSWVCPWIAGMYALAVQVKPDLTPDLFWKTALETSNNLVYTYGNETLRIDHVVNPAGIVAALQK